MIELHDDDPEDFEIALRYMYSHSNINSTESVLRTILEKVNEDSDKRLFLTIGAYIIADKYDIVGLEDAANVEFAECFSGILAEDEQNDYAILNAILTKYYGSVPQADTVLGQTLARVLLDRCVAFIGKEKLHETLKTNPTFSADIALCVSQSGRLQYAKAECERCDNIFYGEYRGRSPKFRWCPECGHRDKVVVA